MLDVDPDIVIIGAQNQADVYDQLMVDPVLAGMSAVKNGTVYRAPQGIFPWCRNGPEAAIQMVWAAKLLHPAEFADVDYMPYLQMQDVDIVIIATPVSAHLKMLQDALRYDKHVLCEKPLATTYEDG